jgi:hypothetical protein
MDTNVRFTTAGGLNPRQRGALALLADHGSGAVGRSTGVTDGGLVIHSSTALALARSGFAQRADDGGIEITDDGLQVIGRLRESPAQRKARQAREAIEAERSGKWKRAPAGASADAQAQEWEARHEWAETHEAVRHAREQLNWARQMLRLAEEWGEDEDASRAEVERAEADLSAANDELERLRQSRDRAA